MPWFTDIIGYVAAFLGAILMLPQVVKSFRSRSAKDISLVMVFVYLLVTILWIIYGYLISSNPLIVCNGTAFFIGIAQLVLKMKYSK